MGQIEILEYLRLQIYNISFLNASETITLKAQQLRDI